MKGLAPDNLLCPGRRAFIPATTDSRHKWRGGAYSRGWHAGDRPRSARGADITYLRLLEEFAFLVVVLDAFSRRVIAWAAARHLRAGLAEGAPETALVARRPSRGQLIHHSDRDVQYA